MPPVLFFLLRLVIYHRNEAAIGKAAGVNFINVLQAAFKCANPKSAKKTVKSSSFFALLGSASVTAARRTLVKLTPGGAAAVVGVGETVAVDDCLPIDRYLTLQLLLRRSTLKKNKKKVLLKLRRLKNLFQTFRD